MAKNIIQAGIDAAASALGMGSQPAGADAEAIAKAEAEAKAKAEAEAAAAAKAAAEADAKKVEAFVLRDCNYGEAGTVVRLDAEDAKLGADHGMLDLNKGAIAAAKKK